MMLFNNINIFHLCEKWQKVLFVCKNIENSLKMVYNKGNRLLCIENVIQQLIVYTVFTIELQK